MCFHAWVLAKQGNGGLGAGQSFKADENVLSAQLSIHLTILEGKPGLYRKEAGPLAGQEARWPCRVT